MNCFSLFVTDLRLYLRSFVCLLVHPSVFRWSFHQFVHCIGVCWSINWSVTHKLKRVNLVNPRIEFWETEARCGSDHDSLSLSLSLSFFHPLFPSFFLFHLFLIDVFHLFLILLYFSRVLRDNTTRFVRRSVGKHFAISGMTGGFCITAPPKCLVSLFYHCPCPPARDSGIRPC